MKFRRLGISEEICKVIDNENFEEPSEVQDKAIPLILEGKDVIAGSATGSGKTLAFGAGIIQNSHKGAGIQALILTPTRELAEQVMNALKKFSKHKPLRIISIYGGVSINPQIDRLQTADIVVGTPGRILDHIDRNTINLREINCLILDEADRMLDMGFLPDVENIINECNKQRQTLLFSATISQEITKLARKYMKNPVKVSVECYVDPSKLKQVYYNVPDNMKFSFLVHLLKNEDQSQVMVFSNTRRNADFIVKNLKSLGINALAIHGGFTQDKRNKTMERFHSQNFNVLVCTDVAARGLDIKDVSHVYNYDIPKDSKEYIHRIGRTARAGKEGKVVNILSERDHDNMRRVQEDRSLCITQEPLPFIEKVRVQREPEQRRSGFRRGNNRSNSNNRRGSFNRRPRPRR